MNPAGKEKILVTGTWGECIKRIKSPLKKEGYRVDTAPPDEIRAILKEKNPDLVMLCVSSADLPDASGKIREIKQVNDTLPVVVITDDKSWEPAVSLMKAGASDYAVFPVAGDKLKKTAARHIKFYKMTKRIFLVEDDPGVVSPFEGIVGRSHKMQENFRMIQAVSKSNATVLITGESGTGKELVAKAIHQRSDRRSFRFVDLNCGAIPKDLLENELFGHEKGSFTGAHKRYNGSFETAHNGTLFLDEISEMDPILQVKILRVLQERSFMRIGGTEKIDVDVRIIAATNKNLAEAIKNGRFREDLFYRLNVVGIPVPPLRERREDIPLLAMHFLEFLSAKNSRIFLDFSNDVMEALINHDWPGNVRELENTVERIVVLHNDSQVKMKFLPRHIQKVAREISYTDVSREAVGETRVAPLDDIERQAIEMALMKFQGNITVAAKKLKIGQATLYRKVKKYGLDMDKS